MKATPKYRKSCTSKEVKKTLEFYRSFSTYEIDKLIEIKNAIKRIKESDFTF